jgi:hypothetical protein
MARAAATTAGPAAKTSDKAPAKSAGKAVTNPAPKAAVKKSAATPVKAIRAAPAPAPKASAPGSAATEPSLRFHHSKALRAKTLAVLDALEAAPAHPRHGDALADLVTELIEAGMDYYFMRALKQAQVGFVAEQSARLGMTGAVKLMSSVNRKFILRMNQDQLLIVARHIRELG